MPRVFADPLRERVARCSAVVGLDALSAAAALGAAMALRFEEGIPPPYSSFLPAALALAVAVRLAANGAARLHRWELRLAGFPEAVRIAAAALGGSALFVPLSALLLPEPLPRTVYALEFFLASTAFTAIRFGPRFALRWWAELRRRRSGAAPTLVVGVNFAAELLARDLAARPGSPYAVVGFVGADAADVGLRLDGKPVLGVVGDLAALVARHRVRAVLLAVPRPAAARIREAVAACARRGVRFKILPACASVAEPVSAAMLDDLAPEDLLPRAPAGAGRGELRRRVAGRRALVCGAGGALGAEICRHLAHHGVRQLVMVDASEGELLARARRLVEEQPGVDVRAEAADPRAPGRVGPLLARYRPDYVFHVQAGAGPEGDGGGAGEARGALRAVARAADACGVRRLVVVSAAGAPGGEGALRELARGSRTRVTAVRVGDVLGAAALLDARAAEETSGEAVPPAAGPRFMTLAEAAGLALAGLGDGEEPWVEGRGRPVPVHELARLALALSGGAAGAR